MADLAVNDLKGFGALVKSARSGLAPKAKPTAHSLVDSTSSGAARPARSAGAFCVGDDSSYAHECRRCRSDDHAAHRTSTSQGCARCTPTKGASRGRRLPHRGAAPAGSRARRARRAAADRLRSRRAAAHRRRDGARSDASRRRGRVVPRSSTRRPRPSSAPATRRRHRALSPSSRWRMSPPIRCGRGDGGGSRPLLLVLDAVTDPGNLGTILRCALAADVDEVLLAPGCADPLLAEGGARGQRRALLPADPQPVWTGAQISRPARMARRPSQQVIAGRGRGAHAL